VSAIRSSEPIGPHSGRTAPRRPRHRRSLSPSALAVGGLCLIVLALTDLVIAHERGVTGDGQFYERMATHPGGPHNFPYAYRIAVPWLVHVLPFSHVVSFTGIAFLAIAVSGAALYELLDDFHVGSALAVGLVMGFVLSPTLLVVLVRHSRSIDPASILVMMLGCLFIVRRQRLAFAVTLLIGMAVRESSLFLIPFAYAIWAQRPVDREALRDVALTCLLPLVAYIVIRTSIDAVGKQYIPGYSGSFLQARLDFIRSAFSGGTAGVELRRLAYTYGPIWLIAPLALRDSGFARRGLVLVALCVASMTYAYDWGRIIFLAAPVFYVAGGLVLRNRHRLATAGVVALLAVDIGYGIYLQAYGVTHGLDETSQRIPVF
jgi:hypothetical protein